MGYKTIMPTAFKNAKYYNLVKDTLLNPKLLTKYAREIEPCYLTITENPELLTFNLSPLEIQSKCNSHGYRWVCKTQHFVYNKNKADFWGVWNRIEGHSHNIIENKINDYVISLWYNKHLEKYGDYDQVKLINKLLKNNTYNIRDMLNKAMCDAYFNKYIAPSVIKAIAINKIKRNAIYNNGLGLKLAVKEYSKEF